MNEKSEAGQGPRCQSMAGLMLSLLAGLALVGCGDKPPGCADPQVTKMISDGVIEEARGILKDSPSDQMAAFNAFFAAAKVGVDQITTDGYDEKAKRHECQGTLTLAEPRGERPTARFTYSVQAVEGKPGEFLLRSSAHPAVSGPQVVYYAGEYFYAVKRGEVKLPGSSAANTAQAAPESGPASPQPATPVAEVPASAPAEVAASAVRPIANQAAPDAGPPPASSATKSAPSFSCTGKLSTAEQMICDTPALAQADAQLARAYSAALAASADQAALKQQQRDWRKGRDACGDAACMSDAYAKRIAELAK